jgi:hypothetical protein
MVSIMDLIQGAKELSERIAKRDGKRDEVVVAELPIPVNAIPLFRWTGVVPPASKEADA